MPNKYGKDGTANWILNNSKMWAYPNDKRKTSEEIPITVSLQDGNKLNYTIYRGKILPDSREEYGQPNAMYCGRISHKLK